MFSYVIRRLFVLAPVVVGAISILFFLFFLLPGDEAEFIAGGGERNVPESVLQNVKERYDLDKPWYVQYANYWKRTAQGDFGESYQSRDDVSEIIKRTAAASTRLAIWAIIIEVMLGIGAGVLSAVKRYSFIDGLTTVSTAAVSAVPVFVLGLLLQQMTGVFPNQHDWPQWARLPVQGIGPDTWRFFFIPTGEQWRYLIQPALVLASVSTAVVARMTRATMLEVNRTDYMRTARAKGLAERRVVFGHGLRNALIPVVTLIGIDFGTLIGSAILTETVFNWPGIGSRIAVAISDRDAPVILGLSLVVVVVYVVVNLIVDLSYAYFDPRIRLGKARS